MACLTTRPAQCNVTSSPASLRNLNHKTAQSSAWQTKPALKFQHTNSSTNRCGHRKRRLAHRRPDEVFRSTFHCCKFSTDPWLNHARTFCVSNCFEARVGVEFCKDMFDVIVNCSRANVKLVRDRFRARPRRQSFQHFNFSSGETRFDSR